MTSIRRRGAGTVIGALAVVLAGLYIAVVIVISVAPGDGVGFDRVSRAHAFERASGGEPLYLDPTGELFYPGSLDHFYGPPILAVAAAPWAGLPDDLLRALSMPLGIAITLAAAILVSDGLRPTQRATLAIGLMLSYSVFASAFLGAASLITLIGVALADRALRTGHDRIAGVALGVIAALRVYPILLFVPLVVARRWGAVIAAFGSAGAMALIGIVVLGPDELVTFASFAPRLATAGATSALPVPLGWVIGWAVLVLAGARLRHPLGWGLACVGMLAASPVVWDHYLTAMLPLVTGLQRGTGRSWPGLLPILWFRATLVGPLPVIIMGAAAIWSLPGRVRRGEAWRR